MINLTGQFIANTFQNLVQKPDTEKEEYFNGVGTPIYINGDPIGTVKMFFPIGGTFGTYFDPSTGLGKIGSSWYGWAVADGRNGTPDLRGRTTFGVTDTGNTSTVGNDNATAPEFSAMGATGGNTSISINNLPPHRHQYFDAFMNAIDGSNVFSTNVDAHAAAEGVLQGPIYTDPNKIEEGVGAARDAVWYDRNTGDGSSNIGNQGELKSSPDNFYNPYITLMYVIKVV